MPTKQTNTASKSNTRPAKPITNKAPKRLFVSVAEGGYLNDTDRTKKSLIKDPGNVIATYELVSISKPVRAPKSLVAGDSFSGTFGV